MQTPDANQATEVEGRDLNKPYILKKKQTAEDENGSRKKFTTQWQH